MSNVNVGDKKSMMSFKDSLKGVTFAPSPPPAWRRIRARKDGHVFESCQMCAQPAQWTLDDWPWCKVCMTKHLHPALLPAPHPADATFARLAGLGGWTADRTGDLCLARIGVVHWLTVKYDGSGVWSVEHYDPDRYRVAPCQTERVTHERVVDVVRARLVELGLMCADSVGGER